MTRISSRSRKEGRGRRGQIVGELGSWDGAGGAGGWEGGQEVQGVGPRVTRVYIMDK